MLKRLVLFLALAVLTAAQAAARGEQPATFDYYVLSLSWSPTYCAGKAVKRNDTQCAPGRRFAFVVHGLWPQYETGWPERCRTSQRWVPKRQIRDMLDIMPSTGLIIHEWKKHGTCSGLSQKGYFGLTRRLFDKVKIPARYLSPNNPVHVTPAQLVTDFVKTNRGLTPDMLSVQCGNRRDTANLRELRICFTKAGALRACGSNERRACRAETLVLPPVR
jgi:ribonuclease T2